MSTSNYTRADLLRYTAAMNQMRNAVYHLVRRMAARKVSNIEERLQAMGQRAGIDYAKIWSPETRNFEKFVKEVYYGVLRSKVKVDVDAPSNTVKITDKNCPHCKYPYNDVSIAGCNVVLGFMEAYTREMQAAGKISFALKALGVSESKTLGNQECIHLYRLEGKQ
ncbi:MAG TPA: hypothetical protein VKK79_22365 [Candidatus Lokiarchaeia archaeon]|nr:hypothetical protein [Candidatus Lokiarchaeia archaeon]